MDNVIPQRDVDIKVIVRTDLQEGITLGNPPDAGKPKDPAIAPIGFEKKYEKAFEMFKQQHDRWKDWAIFFFGLIAAAFAIGSYAHPSIPICIPPLFGMIMSCLLVCVVLSIRATTNSWIDIIKDLEALDDEKQRESFDLMQRFMKKLNDRSHWRDLGETLLFTICREKKKDNLNEDS
jgi:hypothetical protein